MKQTKSNISWKKTFHLITDYFLNSDEKLVAWLLLIGTALCVVALVVLIAAFGWWSAGFWALLAAKAITPFLISMGEFTLLLGTYVGIHVLKNFLIGKLSILWRDWLTKKIIKELFGSENNYLDLKRFSSEIDNIEQRIQEDVESFVDLTLNLGVDFLKSTLTLVMFVGTLWVIGGPLAFAVLGINIVIPGYLVWVALIVAIAATAITYFIGKSLPKAKQNVEHAEAEFRQELAQLNEEAENIAEEHAEIYYETSLNERLLEVKNSANQKLNAQTKVVAFQDFYGQLAGILPNILAAPLYFTGLIELAQLMQIGMSFAQVSMSLSWFVESYSDLATYKANIERIAELQKTFEEDGLDANPKLITRKERDKESLKIKHLDLKQPQATSTQYMMRNLNLKLIPGENVLIKGQSGVGKSTLFKVISGTWKYGEGTVAIPAGKRFYFLPQRPTLPYGTLKTVLAYPEPVTAYTENEYISALEAIGNMDDFIPRLDEIQPWSKLLSGGEQQRIAFARALLKKPDWLFLDESTSALDEESEEHVYRLITKELKDTTIVSIGHRSTVEKYHSKIVLFNVNEEREVKVEEYAGLDLC